MDLQTDLQIDVVTIPFADFGKVLHLKPERIAARKDAPERYQRIAGWLKAQWEKRGLLCGEMQILTSTDWDGRPRVGFRCRAIVAAELPEGAPVEKLRESLQGIAPTAKKEIRWLRSLPKLQGA